MLGALLRGDGGRLGSVGPGPRCPGHLGYIAMDTGEIDGLVTAATSDIKHSDRLAGVFQEASSQYLIQESLAGLGKVVCGLNPTTKACQTGRIPR